MKLSPTQINLVEEYEQELREKARLQKNKREMTWHYDNVVVGGTVDAIYFALDNGYPIILKYLDRPTKQAKSIRGNEYHKIYDGLVFALGFLGLNLFAGNKIEDLEVAYDEEKETKDIDNPDNPDFKIRGFWNRYCFW